MQGVSVGNLFLELKLDPSSYAIALENARKQAIATGKDIEAALSLEGRSLVINVDDSRLTALNKHLDRKIVHLKSVQNYFNLNPLKIRVDDSSLSGLNNKLSSISQTTVNVKVSVNTSSIQLPSLASNFTITPKINRTEIEKQLKEVYKVEIASKITGEIKVEIEQGKNTQNPITLGLKNVEKAVRASKPNNVLQGIQNSFGYSIASGIKQSLKTNLGYSSTNASQKAASFVLEKLKVDERIKKAAPVVKQAQSIIQEIIPESELSARFVKIEKRFVKVLDDLTRGKSLETHTKNTGKLVDELSSLKDLPVEGLKKRRSRIIQETARNIRKNYDHDAPKSEIVDPSAEYITLVSGGFAGAGGRSGKGVAQKMSVLLGEKHHTVPIENTHTDTSGSKQELGLYRWLAEAGGKIFSHNVLSGINPDSITMATKAHELQRQNPGKQIRFAGYSAGGFVAHDAMEIAKAMGMPAKAIAVGTPHWGKMSRLDSNDYKALLREKDGVTQIIDMIKPIVGGMDKKKTVSTPGKDHDLGLYLSEETAQSTFLNQMYGGKKQPLRTDLLHPAAFDFVTHKSDAQEVFSSLEFQMENPMKDPTLAKKLLANTAIGTGKVKNSLIDSLPHLSDSLKEEAEQ